ncbi:type II and III secretion system protein family protein [Rhabdaerophilum sp. SD176]|uniref:type II and III secretion system protein family protein n=1 Tax=Rhabdaerophilum sp. SD176 TaxID=2983548 RepID=UPI0024DF49C4|nr:type II and III secretion system protein family protein [Rhabdaerophilum sp. SD176]
MNRPASEPVRPPTGASPMISRLRSLLLGACAAMAATTAFASPPPKHFGGVPFESIPVPRIQPNDHDQVMARRIDLSVGKSIVIDLPRDAAEVFVSEPKVANAVVRTARKVFIIGTGQGTTSVFVTDKNGAQIAALDIGVAKELARELAILREVIKKALPKADIKVTSVGDNFVLSGTVDSALEVQSAIDIANNLVGQSGGFLGIGATSGKVVNALQVRGRDQVMLKVTIAEVQRSVLKQLGINLDGQWSVADSSLRLLTDNPFNIQREGLLSDTAIQGNLSGKTGTLRALERQGVLRTLAEPTLTAISGESAKFLAGGEMPVPQAETCTDADVLGRRSCTITLVYKPVGVTLNFTPVVMSENRISVRLATEVTEVDPDNSYKLSNSTVPGFRTRKAETTVELPSGGVLGTAGLIQQVSRQAINGLPGLMNLPILGTMFRSRDYQRFETELLILVQPFIAKPSTPGQIARPDDGFAEATDPSTIFMGRLNRTYGATAKTPAVISKSGRVGFIHD